tara:strand:+ start:957 stop:1730 length:774 start_codon:yes stop_codon:yes gene_type:complete
MKEVILVLTIFLVFLLILYSVKENFQSGMSKCLYEFKPYGESVTDCSSKCLQNNLRTRGSCSRSECNIICKECNTPDCKWKQEELNKIEKLRPDPIRIKVFSGNRCLKINWVRPYSEFDILKYYVIVSSKSHSTRPFFLEIYNVEESNSLVEFFVGNLENNVLYSVFVICKNKLGHLSIPSNTESVVTDENSEIRIDVEDKDLSVSDSIESKENSFTISREQQPIYQKNVIFNDVKEILLERFNFKSLNNLYNINIY